MERKEEKEEEEEEKKTFSFKDEEEIFSRHKNAMLKGLSGKEREELEKELTLNWYRIKLSRKFIAINSAISKIADYQGKDYSELYTETEKLFDDILESDYWHEITVNKVDYVNVDDIGYMIRNLEGYEPLYGNLQQKFSKYIEEYVNSFTYEPPPAQKAMIRIYLDSDDDDGYYEYSTF